MAVVKRKGWYSADNKLDEEEKRQQDEKEARLVMSQIVLMKQCDNKVTRCRSLAERQRTLEEKEASRAREAADLKQREIEATHRLAAELSRRKHEEIKRAQKLRKKHLTRSPSRCALSEAKSHLAEEKTRLEASQTEILKLWHEDEEDQKLRQAKMERKKQDLRVDLRNQLADNRRRAQMAKTEEKRQDREMMERIVRTIHEEDTKTRRKKDDNAALERVEMVTSLAAKETWEKKYKGALRIEDERIARIVAEKEARQKKMIDKKTKFHAAQEAVINKGAKKLLDCTYKKREKEKVSEELYQEEQKSEWLKEPAKLALKKQRAVEESLKEMARRAKSVADRKAKDDAIDAAFARYLAQERKKNDEKERIHNDARHVRNIQYGAELKEAIINNRASYAMNILEQQSEPQSHSIVNQFNITSMEEPKISEVNAERVKHDLNVKEGKCNE